MMKKIYLLAGLLASLLLACVEDKGNYVYRELNEVTIGEFRDTIVEQFTRYRLEPEITVASGEFDEAAYDYVWHTCEMYSTKNTSDTLSFEKDLDVEITNIPGLYALIFTVTEKETGVVYNQTSYSFEVINSYSKGMLALSRVGDDANLTFVNVAGTVIEDAYKKVNGEVVGKHPVCVSFVGGSILSGAEDMIVITTDDERGGSVIDALDMTYMMSFADMFYFVPEVLRPEAFGIHDYTAYEYVINNGSIYTRDVMGNGLFPKYGVRIGGEYERIAPFNFFNALSPQYAYFYDQDKERFVYMMVPLQGDDVIPFQDISGEFNPNNMGMQMLWGGVFGTTFALTNGRAVMEDHGGNRYMISFTLGTPPVLTPLKKFPLDKEGGREAHSFTTAQSANFLYYAYGNKIACVSYLTGNLMSVFEVQGGNIDHIECDQIGNVSQLWVGISDGSGADKSGSIVVLEMSTDGSLKEVVRYMNICGQVVDFEYKKA